MSTEIEVKEKLEHVKKKIMIFEWDKNRNQLNAGKIPLFNELKEEQVKLELELQSFSKEEEAKEIKTNLEG